MSTAEINLLKRVGGPARDFNDLENKLRLAAWWSLAALLGVGIIIGSTFFFLKARSGQMSSENTQMGGQIDAQVVKEGILVSLKERSDVAGKALEAVRPWGNLFPILIQIAPATQLKSLSIDETTRVSLLLSLGSVDDAVTVVTNVISLSGLHTVRSPQLLSFSIKDDGTVQMGVSFIPIL